MKIITKEEFMSLPRYTVYSRSNRVNGPLIGDICIKQKMVGKIDFYFTCINDVRPANSELSFLPELAKLIINPDIEYPGFIKEHKYSECNPSDEDRFIVYDRHEIKQIINQLQKSLNKLDALLGKAEDPELEES